MVAATERHHITVIITPGQSIQAAVDANPAGTTFVIRGTHHGQQVVLPYKNDLSFIGEEDAVLIGDGQEHAFTGKTGQQTGDRIRLSSMEITGYAPPRQEGVIQGFGEAWDWTLEGLDIHHNANVGIRGSQGWQVLRCHIHHQGSMGVGGGRLYEDCEIDHNNTEPVDPSWEGGGSKWVWSDETVVRRCFIHDNYGPGLWTDGNIRNILFEHNRVWDNYGPGIFTEISRDALIHDNDVRRNGFGYTGWIDGSGILVGDSANIEVYGNTVLWNNDGIAGKHTNRGSGAYGEYTLKNLHVHDNIIGMNHGQTGIVWNPPGTPDDPSWGNRFERNSYILKGKEKHFRWGSNLLTFPEWQTVHEPDGMLAIVPSRPRRLRVSNGTLTWLPPSSDGGLPVIDYRVKHDGVIVQDGVGVSFEYGPITTGVWQVAAVTLAGRGTWNGLVI